MSRLSKAVRRVTSSFKGSLSDIRRDPSALARKITRAGVAYSTVGSSEYIRKQMREKRAATRAEEEQYLAGLDEETRKTQELANAAYDKYLRGEIDPAAKAGIEKNAEIRAAQMREALGKAGIGDSTTALSAQRSVDQVKTGELDSVLDEEFAKSLTALGLDQEATSFLQSINKAERQAAAQSYASFMFALGKIGSTILSKSDEDTDVTKKKEEG